jgi:lysophospholipase L1-like esterase
MSHSSSDDSANGVGEKPQFGLLKSLLFSAILIGTVLVGGELLVRGWAYYLREDVERWDPGTETFVLVPGRYRDRGGIARVNADGFVGRPLEADGPDLWRIVAVGDSCTYGGGHSRKSYPAQLHRMLQEDESPGRRYEVVNAGISGLNSQLALRRLVTKVLPLHPDVVVIYIGWNDLMKFNTAAQGRESGWAPVARALDSLWLVKGMRKLFFYYVRPYVQPPATGPESGTGRFAGFLPQVFEANVHSMIEAVREAGAVPVLATLPSVVRADMTARDVREAGVFFPYFRSAYGVLDFLDLIESYNDTIRSIAESEDVLLVDLAERFRRLSDPRPYFFDTMHPNGEGYTLVALALREALVREGLLGAPEGDG